MEQQLKLSRFKLQLRALTSEVRELRERERSASDQIRIMKQKQKQTEEEFSKRLAELEAELASSNELREKLEKQVSCLQNDNALLENKQKELKGTINSLLQSRDVFVKAYEDSFYEMRRSIESRDRKITVLSDKINDHLLLCSSIEREALSVKQVVDNVHQFINEKEELAAGLKIKLDKFSAYENLFLEKINKLENKLKNDQDELRRKDKIIWELEAQIEMGKIKNTCQQELEELQKSILVKDQIIQNLTSENKVLHFEVGSLEVIIKKIQDTVTRMNVEDRRAFSSMLPGQETHTATGEKDYSSQKAGI